MTDAFLAMQYPHWLLVAGVILVVLGFIGLALRQGKGVEVNYEPTELAPTQANRKAKLAEQTRTRWAKKDSGTIEELLNDRPKRLTKNRTFGMQVLQIPQPDIEPLSGLDHDEPPLFLRSAKTTE